MVDLSLIWGKLFGSSQPKTIPEVFPHLSSSTCSWQSRQSLTAIQTELGNGEQTTLLLNNLFMLLLPTEFSYNATTWKESTSDNRHLCLSHLYHIFLCLSRREKIQLMPRIDKREVLGREDRRLFFTLQWRMVVNTGYQNPAGCSARKDKLKCDWYRGSCIVTAPVD